MLQGYGGLRARSDRMDWHPVLPPHISTVKFVRLSYAGCVYSLSYSATQVHTHTHTHTLSLSLLASRGLSSCHIRSCAQARLEIHSGPSLSVCSPAGSSGPQDCFSVSAGVPATLSTAGFSLRLRVPSE